VVEVPISNLVQIVLLGFFSQLQKLHQSFAVKVASPTPFGFLHVVLKQLFWFHRLKVEVRFSVVVECLLLERVSVRVPLCLVNSVLARLYGNLQARYFHLDISIAIFRQLSPLEPLNVNFSG